MKITHGVLILALLATPVAAATLTYNFDGTLTDHFSRVIDQGRYLGQPIVPADNELEYHNNSNQPGTFSNLEVVMYDLLQPAYDHPWDVSVDLTVPLAYDPFADAVFDAYIGVGLGVGFVPNGYEQAGQRILATGLELDRFGGTTSRGVMASYQNEDLDSEDDSFLDATGVETTRVTIAFDPITKVLSVTSDLSGTPIYEIDIDEGDENDWGMTDDDQFVIGLFGESGGDDNLPIVPSTPLLLDNFEANMAPEPASIFLCIGGLGLIFVMPRLCA